MVYENSDTELIEIINPICTEYGDFEKTFFMFTFKDMPDIRLFNKTQESISSNESRISVANSTNSSSDDKDERVLIKQILSEQKQFENFKQNLTFFKTDTLLVF